MTENRAAAPASRRLQVYVWSVVVAGSLVIVVSLTGASVPPWSGRGFATSVLLAAGIVVGELLPARIWRGDAFRVYTFSGTFTVALLVTGPFWLALVVQLLASLLEELTGRGALFKALFNLGQYTLGMAGARLVFAALTGQPFGAYNPRFTSDQLFASLAAAGLFFAVNVLLVSVVLALARNEPLLASVGGHLRDELTMTTMLLCVAPVIVLSLQFSLWTAPLCLLPIAAVRQAARAAANSDVQALHDSLTGLPNRLLFMQRGRRVTDLARDGEQTALLLLDLDHFKEINDTLGHHVGDDLLRLVSERLRSVVRDADTVARIGGDEFAVLCAGLAGVEEAEAMSQRLADALGEPFALEQISLHVGASVGLALLPLHADGVEHLVQCADVALYEAKTDRATIRTYDPAHDVNSVERLALMEELRAALDSQLVLHYQPKCRASDGALVGVEVLVRWQHPTRGLMYPDEFVPGAENSGLVVPMTMLILRQALRQAGRWRDAGLFVNVAVNMSPRHLADVDLPAHVRALLDEEGLPGSVLTLEVTENSIMSDPARAGAVLRQLRGLGIGVSIDDFGTGYSSLAYLRDLCATEVKIDKTFVMNAARSPRDLAIVKAAADLGHSLGLQVVAEGIEDTATAALMEASGCDVLQGYLILPPAPADELVRWSRRPQAWSPGLPDAAGARGVEDRGASQR